MADLRGYDLRSEKWTYINGEWGGAKRRFLLWLSKSLVGVDNALLPSRFWLASKFLVLTAARPSRCRLRAVGRLALSRPWRATARWSLRADAVVGLVPRHNWRAAKLRARIVASH